MVWSGIGVPHRDVPEAVQHIVDEYLVTGGGPEDGRHDCTTERLPDNSSANLRYGPLDSRPVRGVE